MSANPFVQPESATEIAIRVHQEAVERHRRDQQAQALIDVIRPMVRRYLDDGFKGDSDHWNRLVRLVRMWERG